MRRIIYNMMICCAAAWLLAACSKDDDLPGGQTGGNGNSIILDISSGALPVSRATVPAEGAEVAVSHIDVLIFNDTDEKTKVWSDRVNASANETGRITLPVKRSSFTENERYWVYLIANSTHPEKDFENLANLNALKAMTQEDENIHLTGKDIEGVPGTFLMDGIAYPAGTDEPETPGKVVLYNGNLSDKTELAVTLRRAAAKIVVKIKKGKDVIFDNSPEAYRAGYYLRNMPYSTTLIPNPDANDNVKLWTPDRSASKYFAWTENEITVTAYAYSYNWKDKPLERETRLVVNIPLYYKTETDLRGDNYYQIPISKEKVLERNTYYEVTVEVNAPGATEILKPEELEPVNYIVQAWDETIINVGGETDRPKYLTVNEEEMEMYNISDDNTTLEFASSSEVLVKVTRVYYIDKFGQTQATTSEREIARMGINVVPDKGLNGNINIHSPLPTNNTIRYIELEITNEDGVEARKVTVAQYPLEYITNIQGWYSSREDFGSTWENPRGTPKRVSADTYSRWNDEWTYSATEYGQSVFFTSKVAEQITSGNNKGKSSISYYYFRRNSSSEFTQKEIWAAGNARMYHVRITASSGDYTIGKPRITADGITDPGRDNEKLVSPSFMIASQLGAVYDVNSVEMAASHCKQYVEVYKDEKGKSVALSDWRLPTRAELEIIIDFQYRDNAAMDEVLAGKEYYSASGVVNNPSGSNTSGGVAIRCIRDAFDTQK